uniref:Amino acid transporter transmembrane domain-containing protein n=1 Tax=Alexandrium monilatum TaxID=311494 RepID=A0A7S4PVV0_9DINO
MRSGVAAASAALVLWPLSLLRRFHQLAAASWVAAIAVFGTALSLAWRSMVTAAAPDPAPLLIGSGAGILRTVPILVFALNIHVQAVPIHAALSAERRRLVRRAVAPAAMACCSVAYVLAGLCAARQLGAGTPGDVLRAYGDEDKLMAAAKAAMALHLALGYPVVFLPGVRSVGFAMSSGGSGASRAARAERLLHGGDSGGGATLQVTRGETPTLVDAAGRHALLVTLTVLCTTSLAVLFPQVSSVFGLTGAIFGSTIIYLLPVACCLAAEAPREDGDSSGPPGRRCGSSERGRARVRRWALKAVAAYGMCVAVLGTLGIAMAS